MPTLNLPLMNKQLIKPRQPLGSFVDLDRPRGYHIDLRVKAVEPRWQRPADPSQVHWVTQIQWGLAAFEHYVAGRGEEWRQAALEVGDYLCEQQVASGPRRGAWEFGHPFAHTFELTPPWIMSMAQGEGASLLVRLALDTGSDRYAEAASRAVEPLALTVEEGGVRARLPTGGVLFQEFPTDPPAHVLNGAIFTLFGLVDAARGLGDERARRELEVGLEGLLDGLHLWDLGYWSRYDLFPHPLVNVASPFYHDLHVQQLLAMERFCDDARISRIRRRFQDYALRPLPRVRGMAGKIAFRMVKPRGERLRRLVERRR